MAKIEKPRVVRRVQKITQYVHCKSKYSTGRMAYYGIGLVKARPSTAIESKSL